jgi:AcrR family transcriptional regulator
MTLERLTPERRRAQTREHLLAAAAEVFARRGFHAATLDEIADAAGFSKGAVYSNFSSKDELFLTLIRAKGEALIDAFARAEEGEEHDDQASQVARLADVYLRSDEDLTREWALATEFDLYALRRPEILAQLNANARAVHARTTELVEAETGRTGVVPSLPPEDLATVYMAIFRGLWQQKALDPDSVPNDLAARAVVFLTDAVRAIGKPPSTKRRARKRTPGVA